MKTKIFNSLKTKFNNLGFSDKAFEGVATFLAATITEEDQIETAIEGVEPMFKAFQGDADSRVNSALKKIKPKKQLLRMFLKKHQIRIKKLNLSYLIKKKTMELLPGQNA